MELNIDKTISNVEDQLKLWGAKLNELVAKAQVVGQESKIEGRKHLDELKAKLEATRSKLDAAKVAGGDKWNTFKADVESSCKDLENAFQKLTH